MIGVGARSTDTAVAANELVRVPDAGQSGWRRWMVPAAVFAIIGIALFVRMIHLTALGFNSDEAVYTGQAGALAGVGSYARNFSPFRAHPLLLQTVLAMQIVLLDRVSEFVSRGTVVLAGVGAVYATYRLGRQLYGVAVGLAAALVLAVMPYHVFISRQVLLDVPAGLAVLLAFAALYRYEGYETRRLLYLAGALAGIACVIKETMIIFAPAALLYLLWAGLLRKTRLRDMVTALVLMLVPLLPFVSTRFFFSGSSSGGYIIYQLFREPNHPAWYFPVVLDLHHAGRDARDRLRRVHRGRAQDPRRQAPVVVAHRVRGVLPVLADEALALRDRPRARDGALGGARRRRRRASVAGPSLHAHHRGRHGRGGPGGPRADARTGMAMPVRASA